MLKNRKMVEEGDRYWTQLIILTVGTEDDCDFCKYDCKVVYNTKNRE
jgi:hypothetical protein